MDFIPARFRLVSKLNWTYSLRNFLCTHIHSLNRRPLHCRCWKKSKEAGFSQARCFRRHGFEKLTETLFCTRRYGGLGTFLSVARSQRKSLNEGRQKGHRRIWSSSSSNGDPKDDSDYFMSFPTERERPKTSEDLLNLWQDASGKNCVQAEDVAAWLSDLRHSVCSEQDLTNVYVQKLYGIDLGVEIKDHTIAAYKTDLRFKDLFSFVLKEVQNISFAQCIKILDDLNHMCISPKDPVMLKLVERCTEKVEGFSLSQLAILVSSMDAGSQEWKTLGRIANRTKMSLEIIENPDFAIEDLCQVYKYVHPLTSAETAHLGAYRVISKLEAEPAENVSVEMLALVCLYDKLSNFQCHEILNEALFDLRHKFGEIKFAKEDLNYAICSLIGMSPLRRHFLFLKGPIRRFSPSQVEKPKPLVQSMIQTAFLLPHRSMMLEADWEFVHFLASQMNEANFFQLIEVCLLGHRDKFIILYVENNNLYRNL